MQAALKGAALAIILFTTGCTAAKLERVSLNTSEDASRLVPTTIFINRNVPVARFYVDRLDAINSTIVQSGVFLDSGSHVRSPYVLDITLDRGTHDTVVDSAGHILSAGTLFLLPSKVHNFNQLNAELYAYGKLIKRYEYTEDYEDVLSIFNMKKQSESGGNEFLSIENLVNTLLNEIQRDGLIPRLKPLPVQPKPATAI